MGFPNDIRHKKEQVYKGITSIFTASGAALAASSAQTVKDTGAGEPGRLLSARLFTEDPEVELRIDLDGERLNTNHRERPKWFMDGYGCCMQAGNMRLARYDTVNNKYVYELVAPPDGIPFGDRMKVELYNPQGSAVKCCGDVNWLENT